MSTLSPAIIQTIQQAVNQERLLETAMALVAVPSPTCSAGAAADRLAAILQADGFTVERPTADWPEAPAVVVRFDTGKPGRILQFDGHLDTVHLPFVPPRVEDGIFYGSGASDMKGGIAAFVEALRVLRDTQSLPGGGILVTAHDHHEGPWGDRRQVYAFIRDGLVGDAVLLPEYLADRLPVAGRGMAIFEVRITRAGEPVHEVLRPANTPDVVKTGAALVSRLHSFNEELQAITAPYVGSDSTFVGHIQAGEIYNQSPTLCVVNGTRRWVTPGQAQVVEAKFAQLLQAIAAESGTQITLDYQVQGEAWQLDTAQPIVTAFQAAYTGITGAPLSLGAKPFVDDGSSYITTGGIPALTHGPDAKGAHTLSEAVPVAELVRVAQVYALTAIGFCGAATSPR
ncbi:MAG: M20/M25/M40 family metallo-hydrolase [Caldilineaceae bacterium]|nr:M20/M25/M40 family metallo-hydrolase [Caldilineaceae bacterium]